jgi:hypothetical protein
MKEPARTVVAWWYAPTSEQWMRWASKPAGSAAEAFQRAAQLSEFMPEGHRFVDVWARRDGKWKHETRYRFGA